MVKIRQNVVRVKCLRFIVLLRKLIIYKFNETTLFDVQNTIHFGTPRHPLLTPWFCSRGWELAAPQVLLVLSIHSRP